MIIAMINRDLLEVHIHMMQYRNKSYFTHIYINLMYITYIY